MSNRVIDSTIENNKIKKRKLNDEDFKILKVGEEDSLLKTRYKNKQLKIMCKYYNLPISGNKATLIDRLYTFFKSSKSVIKIQKCIRLFLLKSVIKAKGPACLKREMCVNDTDFFNMDKLKDINYGQFISYRDVDDKIYGFDIISLYTLLKQENVLNPYNRNKIPTYVYNQVNLLIKLNSIYFGQLKLTVESPTQNTYKSLELRALDIFQCINGLGNYSDFKWFWSLNRYKLIKFIRELLDIWVYRAGLSQDIKREICPLHGNPFISKDITHLSSLTQEELKKDALDIIEKFLSANDVSNKSLGANYVLCALTLVSQEAAESLPWLYESVQQI